MGADTVAAVDLSSGSISWVSREFVRESWRERRPRTDPDLDAERDGGSEVEEDPAALVEMSDRLRADRRADNADVKSSRELTVGKANAEVDDELDMLACCCDLKSSLCSDIDD